MTTTSPTSATEPLPCPQCGLPAVVIGPGPGRLYSIACGNCYDGAPDAGKQLHSWSYGSREAAVFDWNEQCEEWACDREEAADVAG